MSKLTKSSSKNSKDECVLNFNEGVNSGAYSENFRDSSGNVVSLYEDTRS